MVNLPWKLISTPVLPQLAENLRKKLKTFWSSSNLKNAKFLQIHLAKNKKIEKKKHILAPLKKKKFAIGSKIFVEKFSYHS